MLVAGSNGHIAWGFTNSYGDWSDFVVVETRSAGCGALPHRHGSEPFENRDETLEVRGGSGVTWW